ncbi:MAG: hypothetical protein IPN34_17415 [Planctomycetes bacterium]|nr:hypothetical protein [Planctomycetota bacterium]
METKFMSWLNPNADPLPEDPAALHALSRTIERFLAEAVERAEDVEQHEQRDAERREHHRRALELTPRVEKLRAAWTKENVAQAAKEPSKTRQRKKASKPKIRSNDKIAALEMQADELVAEIRQLGIDGEGWTRASLLGDAEVWQYFVETLSLKGRPIHVRLKSKAAIALNAELVRYGVGELSPLEKPELLIKLDGIDIVNRAIHGESAIPIVVGRAKLETAREGAEELRQSINSRLDASSKATVRAAAQPAVQREKDLSICTDERRWRIQEEIEAAFQGGGDILERLGSLYHVEYLKIETELPNRKTRLGECNAFQEAYSELDDLFRLAFIRRHDGVGDLERFIEGALGMVRAAGGNFQMDALFGRTRAASVHSPSPIDREAHEISYSAAESRLPFTVSPGVVAIRGRTRDELGDTEREIIDALGDEKLTAEDLAKRTRRITNSHFKNALSALCKEGVLRNKRPGYVLVRRDLLESGEGQG